MTEPSTLSESLTTIDSSSAAAITSMEVGEQLPSVTTCHAPQPSSNTSAPTEEIPGNPNLPESHSDQTPMSSDKSDMNEVKRIDTVKFQPLDQKLEKKEQFENWKESIISQLEKEKWLFVLDPFKSPPSDFSLRNCEIAWEKVRYFILESLSKFFQDLVHDISDPLEILIKLQRTCDSSPIYQVMRLIKEINTIRFDPKTENATEFLKRFDDILAKLTSLSPDMLSPKHAKLIFENSIEGTAIYEKAKLHRFCFSVSELRDMLLKEQLRNDQSSTVNSAFISKTQVDTPPSWGVSLGGSGGGGQGGLSFSSSTPSKPQHKTASTSKPPCRGVSASSKIQKNLYCSYCRKKGHTKATCCRAMHLCYNCRLTDEHATNNCPYPSTKTLPKGSSSSANPPRLFKMPLGQAKTLYNQLEGHTGSVFSIAGSLSGDNATRVWVTMGEEEEQMVRTINSVSEKQGKGTVYQLYAGDN